MSVSLMSLAFKANLPKVDIKEGEGTHTVKPSTSKFVLVALADHANDEGKGAYPSLDTLSNKTSLERKTVARALDALESLGIIICVGISEYNTDNYTIIENVLKSHVTLGKKESDSREKQALPESHKTSLIQTPNKPDLLDAELQYNLKPKSIRDAIKTYFRLNTNWDTKTSREWMEWAVGENITAEQIQRAAKLWLEDKQFNWQTPTLKGIFEKWQMLMDEGTSDTPTREEGKGFYA